MTADATDRPVDEEGDAGKPSAAAEHVGRQAAAARAIADQPATISEGDAKVLARVAAKAFAQPLGEATRRVQDRLLLASVAALLINTGLFVVEKVTLEDVELRASEVWAIPLTLAVLVSYFVVSYFVAYRRDHSAHSYAQGVPLVSLERLGAQVAGEVSANLERIAAITKRIDAKTADSSDYASLWAAVRAHWAFEDRSETLGSLAKRANALRFVSHWVDLIFPTVVGVIAVAASLIRFAALVR